MCRGILPLCQTANFAYGNVNMNILRSVNAARISYIINFQFLGNLRLRLENYLKMALLKNKVSSRISILDATLNTNEYQKYLSHKRVMGVTCEVFCPYDIRIHRVLQRARRRAVTAGRFKMRRR